MKLDFRAVIQESAKIKLSMLEECIGDIESAAKMMLDAIRNGKKILWCGNGGSAADAQHMAAELMGGLRSHSRKPIASIALTTDTSFITAWANDTSYDEIFSRQLKALGKSDDVLIAISTSGNSKNIVKAINQAKINKLKVISFLGHKGGKCKGKGSLDLIVNSNSTARIQESHITIGHIICDLIEKELKL